MIQKKKSWTEFLQVELKESNPIHKHIILILILNAICDTLSKSATIPVFLIHFEEIGKRQSSLRPVYTGDFSF